MVARQIVAKRTKLYKDYGMQMQKKEVVYTVALFAY
jgi:hypothetical protein